MNEHLARVPDLEDPTPPALLGWDDFVLATTADARCRAWLSWVCGQIPGARVAAVLVESLEAHTYVPMAVWPDAMQGLGRLAEVAELALREKRGIIRPAPPPADLADAAVAADSFHATHLAYPLMLDQREAGVVALEVVCADSDVASAMREIHWGSAWLTNLLAGRELDEAIRSRDRVGSVLEVIAVALRHGKLQQALFEMVNDLRQQFNCARVAVGLVDRARVKLAALSEAATFEKNTSLAKSYVRAMEEAYDHGKIVVSGALSDSDNFPVHRELMGISGATQALSLPLLLGARCVGVVTLERDDRPFDTEDLAWMEAFAGLAAPIVEQRRIAERRVIPRLYDEGKEDLAKLFGPRHLVWKAATSLVVLLVAVLVLVPINYRVGAKTVIEGEVQRVVAAPFEGFISAGFVRAGDIVEQGQQVAQLDDRELRIEQERWASERDQYDSRLREAMANHDLTAVQVQGAQLRQAEAQFALVTEKIQRARLVAPTGGIVVSGDLSQQIGAPAEAGKKLFEIAPLNSYRVILQVDEREIRHVQAGQGGHLVITGIAEARLPLKVQKVTPVATAQDGKNFFRVEASLADTPERLRPGMEGVSKIEVGSHSLWWVMTHSFTDWLILTVWTWLP
ncbi:MAG: guanylate cyclase [Rhodocyclales bacterium RIFCSPLOWO2_02_FULL_63_24]|nr:MAG: guanylate cyclase [Rhodocyclales bacterium RIFCSPLOWO2_02_FULL_63_24]